ncbi:MAG: energy-coupling factor ABC transporter permease [Lachnospiraceae bacterium]|nr:energy-coupling factor ABC transporter permease [Lachnospiraceae bacterium]
MHMADALVSPAVAGTMAVLSGAAAVYSVKKLREEDDPKRIPVMGVMGAFVFAAQMINFTIPGTGSSGHICGGFLISALAGPYAGFLTMIGVLLIQCLFFADGGLLALGCNVWNMAFYGCFIGALLVWKPFMRKGATKARIMAASIIGCIVTLQLGAFSVTVETLLSGITELPFGVFLAAMQPIHLAIGLVEGIITGAVLVFVQDARPELLWGVEDEGREGRFTLKKTLVILAAAAAVIGGAVSLIASALPDGLEWAIGRVAGVEELEAAGSVYESASSIQEKLSFLPDYAFKGSESAAGTTVSGIVGAALVLALCVCLCYILRLFMNRRTNEQN